MKELKYLSKNALELRDIVGISKNIEEVLPLGVDFPETRVRAKFDANHFSIFVGNKQLPFDKSADTELRKVVDGIFKGCYVATEKGHRGKDGKTYVYLLHKDGFVEVAKSEGILDVEEIDKMICEEYFVKLTTEKLNTFDINQEPQAYVYFCQKLPKALFTQSKTFRESVAKKIKEPNLVMRKNNRFVRTKLCKEEAKEFFNSLATEREEEKEVF